MTKLSALVLDFDGVVLESADVKTRAFVQLYASHGEEIASKVRAYHLQNLGISRFKKFDWIAEHLLGTELSEEGRRELGERFSSLALQGVLDAPFVPGADRTLPHLATKLPLFVASGTPDDELKSIVAKRQLGAWFREVHGTPRDKPTILRDLLTRYALGPDEVLFVGDGESDYRAAHEVGVQFLARDTPDLHALWVAHGVRRVPDLATLDELVESW